MTKRDIWRLPSAIAATTLFGLLAALLGEGGLWWALSWVALSPPLVVIVLCLSRPTRRRAKTPPGRP
jgi:hypothetical protein